MCLNLLGNIHICFVCMYGPYTLERGAALGVHDNSHGRSVVNVGVGSLKLTFERSSCW